MPASVRTSRCSSPMNRSACAYRWDASPTSRTSTCVTQYVLHRPRHGRARCHHRHAEYVGPTDLRQCIRHIEPADLQVAVLDPACHLPIDERDRVLHRIHDAVNPAVDPVGIHVQPQESRDVPEYRKRRPSSREPFTGSSPARRGRKRDPQQVGPNAMAAHRDDVTHPMAVRMVGRRRTPCSRRAAAHTSTDE